MLPDKITIKGLKEGLRNKDYTSREALESFQEKLGQGDGQFNYLLSRRPLGLAGGEGLEEVLIPCLAADNYCLQGEKVTCGSKMLQDYVSPVSSFVLEKLQGRGYRVMGKTNLDEFGIGDFFGSSFFQVTHNPLDKGCLAGGGGAAALAAGGALAAFGTDARGSLRLSAVFCGVVGLKPSWGRMSRRGIIEYAPSLEQPGLQALSVGDAALALAAAAGHDDRDPGSCRDSHFPEIVPGGESPGDFQVAVVREWDQVDYLETGVKEGFNSLLKGLSGQGIKLGDTSLPSLVSVSNITGIIAAVEAFSNLANYDGVRLGTRKEGKFLQDMYIQTRTAGFGQRVKEFLTFGALVSGGAYYQEYFQWAQRCRNYLKQKIEEILSVHDFILLPVSPFTAPSREILGSSRDRALDNGGDVYASLANLAGLPAISLPVGKTGEGKSLGVQLVGPAGGEEKLLQMAAFLEKVGGN